MLDGEPQQHERALLWAAAWRRRHEHDAEMEPWERMSPDLMRVSYKDGQQVEPQRPNSGGKIQGMRMSFVIYDEVQQWPEEE